MAAKALLFAALLVQCIYVLTAAPYFGSPLAAAEFPLGYGLNGFGYDGIAGPLGYGLNAFGYDGIAGRYGYGLNAFGCDGIAGPFGYDGIAGPYGFGLNAGYGFGPYGAAIL